MADTQNSEDYVQVRNLTDGPRDYPLRSGAGLYLAAKGKTTGDGCVPLDEISDAILLAEKKKLVRIGPPHKHEEGACDCGCGCGDRDITLIVDGGRIVENGGGE